MKIYQAIQTAILGLICLSLPLSRAGLSTTVNYSSPEIAQNTPQQPINFDKHFQNLNVEGSILIYDLKNQSYYQHNPQRNKTAFSPASTFKILNSLIALETGSIANDLAILTWDGTTRSIPEWNRDLNLREAFKISAVWFYQVLARRTGYEKMKQWIEKVGYGNQNIGTKEDIDKFWLEDDKLRITPQQQIEFLQQLYENKLPFSENTIATVKDIMIAERTPKYTLRAKTGWANFGEQKPQFGWYVGYLEQNQNIYFFATNIEIRNPEDSKSRIELTRRCLQQLGLL